MTAPLVDLARVEETPLQRCAREAIACLNVCRIEFLRRNGETPLVKDIRDLQSLLVAALRTDETDRLATVARLAEAVERLNLKNEQYQAMLAGRGIVALVNEHTAEVERLRAALEDIVASGVSFSDERLDYVEMQISRAALEYARAALAPRPTPPGEER